MQVRFGNVFVLSDFPGRDQLQWGSQKLDLKSTLRHALSEKWVSPNGWATYNNESNWYVLTDTVVGQHHAMINEWQALERFMALLQEIPQYIEKVNVNRLKAYFTQALRKHMVNPEFKGFYHIDLDPEKINAWGEGVGSLDSTTAPPLTVKDR